MKYRREHPLATKKRNRRMIVQLILVWLKWLWQQCLAVWQRYTGPQITLDSGRTVRLGRQIAEGGFSLVFEATEVGPRKKTKNQRYALKRCACPERDMLQTCKKEAAVHRAINHPNVCPLLGMLIENNTCYFLFPLYSHSLRSEVNRRTLDLPVTTSTAPWSPLAALQLWEGMTAGLVALHAAQYTHRDIKLENVLLETADTTTGFAPVLMDFGSAGPPEQPIDTRRQVMEIVEEAASHTTLPYRPPELLEGGVRHGDAPLDYRAVDVWSLGCTFFAVLFGASPKECEFARTSRSHGGPYLQIIDCTPLSILNDKLPAPAEHSHAASWYPNDMIQLIASMLQQDRTARPRLEQVQASIADLIQQHGGSSQQHSTGNNNNAIMFLDDFGELDDNADTTEMALISHRV